MTSSRLASTLLSAQGSLRRLLASTSRARRSLNSQSRRSSESQAQHKVDAKAPDGLLAKAQDTLSPPPHPRLPLSTLFGRSTAVQASDFPEATPHSTWRDPDNAKSKLAQSQANDPKASPSRETSAEWKASARRKPSVQELLKTPPHPRLPLSTLFGKSTAVHTSDFPEATPHSPWRDPDNAGPQPLTFPASLGGQASSSHGTVSTPPRPRLPLSTLFGRSTATQASDFPEATRNFAQHGFGCANATPLEASPRKETQPSEPVILLPHPRLPLSTLFGKSTAVQASDFPEAIGHRLQSAKTIATSQYCAARQQRKPSLQEILKTPPYPRLPLSTLFGRSTKLHASDFPEATPHSTWRDPDNAGPQPLAFPASLGGKASSSHGTVSTPPRPRLPLSTLFGKSTKLQASESLHKVAA
jgi:hypothetical protein